jgi:hypothetical protein
MRGQCAVLYASVDSVRQCMACVSAWHGMAWVALIGLFAVVYMGSVRCSMRQWIACVNACRACVEWRGMALVVRGKYARVAFVGSMLGQNARTACVGSMRGQCGVSGMCGQCGVSGMRVQCAGVC